MRLILVDWLIELQRKLKIKDQSLFMAVQLVDKVIELTHDRFSKSKFQLLGATCLLIASKYEHTYPISVHRVAYLIG
jgi:hypothetical protein